MRLIRWLRDLGRGNVSKSSREPIRLAELLRPYAGKWVAVKDGEVVAAEDTSYALVMLLHQKQIKNATIMRSPSPEEPLRVGLG